MENISKNELEPINYYKKISFSDLREAYRIWFIYLALDIVLIVLAEYVAWFFVFPLVAAVVYSFMPILRIVIFPVIFNIVKAIAEIILRIINLMIEILDAIKID